VGFKERGYLPEAIVNFLAFLGWNPGTDQELFSMEELFNAFEIERIGKAGAKFDIQKANWFNQQYLRAKSDEELADYLVSDLKLQGIPCSFEKAIAIANALRERITFPQDLASAGKLFFVPPTSFDEKIVAKKWNQEAVDVISSLEKEIGGSEELTSSSATAILEKITTVFQIQPGRIMQALRLALTGGASGPDLMITMEILGPSEVKARLGNALRTLSGKVG
jgi:glutamyl-tRNA synthetase